MNRRVDDGGLAPLYLFALLVVSRFCCCVFCLPLLLIVVFVFVVLFDALMLVFGLVGFLGGFEMLR